MKAIKVSVVVSGLLCMNLLSLAGQVEPVKIGRIAERSVVFDGVPDEDVWKSLPEFNLTMWRPDFGKAPSESSDIRLGYDKDYIWVAAKLYMKDASRIFVSTKKRDEMLWDYDAFGILLDNLNDNENGLAFFTNPEGLRTDYAVSNDGSFSGINTSWDTFWDVKTSRDQNGWYVEMRIPFSSLKFKAEDGLTTMGVIFTRNISSNNETDLYPAIDTKYGYSALFKPSEAGKIIIEGAKSSNPVYISPYVITGFSRDHILNNNELQYVRKDKPEYNAGLDVKYNINNYLTLDLTANTDFAQVEADDQQVNLTRYSLFFPEKRKFFQERSGLFDFNLGGMDNLFYSRNIGISYGSPIRIYGGARLTGKAGKWDIGFLDMQTENRDPVPGYNYGVLRTRRQVINENSYAGAIFTSKVGMNGEKNFTYGIDGIFRLFGDDYLSVKLSQTYDSKVDTKLSSLNPAFIYINWERRSEIGFAYNFNYLYSGQEFNPGIGFILRRGVQGAEGDISFGFQPGQDSKIFRSNISLRGNVYTRLEDGGIESMNVSPGFEMTTKSGIIAHANLNVQREGVVYDFNLSDSVKVYAGNYTFTDAQFMIGKTSTTRFSFMSGLNLGQFYDGIRAGINAGPQLSLSASLNISANYSFNTIHFPERTRNNSLNIHAVSIRTLYMLNTKLSASLLVQYMNVQDNLITNFRIRYNPREGNDFYLVYNDLRGIVPTDAVPVRPDYFNKTIMVKYVHTFTIQ